MLRYHNMIRRFIMKKVSVILCVFVAAAIVLAVFGLSSCGKKGAKEESVNESVGDASKTQSTVSKMTSDEKSAWEKIVSDTNNGSDIAEGSSKDQGSSSKPQQSTSSQDTTASESTVTSDDTPSENTTPSGNTSESSDSSKNSSGQSSLEGEWSPWV